MGEGEAGGEDGEGTVVLGTVSIAPEISWITMDSKICDVFMVCVYTRSAYIHVAMQYVVHSFFLPSFSYLLSLPPSLPPSLPLSLCLSLSPSLLPSISPSSIILIHWMGREILV